MRESHVERTSLDLAVELVVGARLEQRHLDPGPRSTERDEELREQFVAALWKAPTRRSPMAH